MDNFKNALSILKECMNEAVPFEASSEEARVETAMIEYGNQCTIQGLKIASESIDYDKCYAYSSESNYGDVISEQITQINLSFIK